MSWFVVVMAALGAVCWVQAVRNYRAAHALLAKAIEERHKFKVGVAEFIEQRRASTQDPRPPCAWCGWKGRQ